MNDQELWTAREAAGAGKQIPGTTKYVDVCWKCAALIETRFPYLSGRRGAPIYRACVSCRLRRGKRLPWSARKRDSRLIAKYGFGRSALLVGGR